MYPNAVITRFRCCGRYALFGILSGSLWLFVIIVITIRSYMRMRFYQVSHKTLYPAWYLYPILSTVESFPHRNVIESNR